MAHTNQVQIQQEIQVPLRRYFDLAVAIAVAVAIAIACCLVLAKVVARLAQ